MVTRVLNVKCGAALNYFIFKEFLKSLLKFSAGES